MQDILVLNNISDIINNHLSEYNITKDAKDPVGVLVRSADMNSMDIPESVLAIARAGAGTNNIPSAKCAEKGIVVFNTPGANSNAVKELAIGLLIVASRNIIDAANWAQSLVGQEGVPKLVEKGKSQFSGSEIKGKKLGVIGLGAIGSKIANAASAMGMEVIGYDPYISVDFAWRLSRAVKRAESEDQIFHECDFITLNIPLNDETRNTINAKTISQMKQGVTILNLSRAELVNSEDMIQAVKTGHVARYVVDFPTPEMLGVENVICIPHLGASTSESEENCADMAAAQLYEYLKFGNITNSVNFPNCHLPWTGKTRLCIIHSNVTNLIGQITASIAAEHINISDMINKSKGEYAYTIVDLDSDLPETVLSKINDIPSVIRTRVL